MQAGRQPGTWTQCEQRSIPAIACVWYFIASGKVSEPAGCTRTQHSSSKAYHLQAGTADGGSVQHLRQLQCEKSQGKGRSAHQLVKLHCPAPSGQVGRTSHHCNAAQAAEMHSTQPLYPVECRRAALRNECQQRARCTRAHTGTPVTSFNVGGSGSFAHLVIQAAIGAA